MTGVAKVLLMAAAENQTDEKMVPSTSFSIPMELASVRLLSLV